MSGFALDERIAADCAFAADWPLCRVLLFDDARYPWLVLVPRRESVTEIFHLDQADCTSLGEETARAARLVAAMPGVAKVNVGALGNLVPQLHVHVIGRHPGDPAWPGPVWGHSPPLGYGPGALAERLALVRGC